MERKGYYVIRDMSVNSSWYYINITFLRGDIVDCHPRSRGWQCFSRGDNTLCHPVKMVYFYHTECPISTTKNLLQGLCIEAYTILSFLFW